MNQRKQMQKNIVFSLLLVFIIGCAQNTPDAVFNRGLRAWESNDFIGASLYFDKFVTDFPEDERVLQAYDYLANCYVKMKEYSSALAVFKEVKEQTDNPMLKMNCDFRIGEMYAQEGNMVQAVSQFKSIADATDNPRIDAGVHSWLAKVYAQQTLSASAVAQYEEMFKIAEQKIDDPTESFELKHMSLSGEANVHLASAEFEEARQTYNRLLDVVNNATGIVGLERDRQTAVVNWANTWALAGDYVSAATIYDQLHDNPNITEEMKPQLVIWKIQSLMRLFREDEGEFTPEQIAALVHENKRLIDDFPKTNYAISARVEIADLIQDTTPTESEKYLQEALELYQKKIDEPVNPRGPLYAYVEIAKAYIKLEKFEEAKQTVQKLQQAYSNDPEAMRASAWLLQLIRQGENEKLKRQQEQSAPPENTPTSAVENQ